MSSLKWLRVVIAVLFFTAMTLFFLGTTDFLPIYPGGSDPALKKTSWHWLAHIQLTPAILVQLTPVTLGLGTAIFGTWFVLTLLTGRIYCSTVCPLGILQDVFSRLSRTVQGKKARYRFRPEMMRTRYAVAIVFLVSLPFFPLGVTLLDPYSNFGRIAASLFRPLYLFANNILAGIAGARFYYQSIHVDAPAVVAAVTILLLVGVLSILFGRRYCNTICPVGTLLGVIAKYSAFKVQLKSDCVSCGLCEKACKGECIDSKAKTVDHSRCVACFNCLSTCRRGSIVYSLPVLQGKIAEPATPENQAAMVPVPVAVPLESDRRYFLRWSVFSLFVPSVTGMQASARAAAPPPDPSLPTGVSRVGYSLTHPVLPPGAESRNRFQHRCTGCHLCVSKCPADIIRPSTLELGLSGFLQPVMKFDHGFCNFNCTICTEVCPSHALVPKSEKEKHRLQIGKVIFLKENCVVETQGSNCGACAEHCPTGAVEMVPFGPPEKSLTIPVARPELCIGCGACEYICPVRPYRAIYVDGMAEHGIAELDYDPDAKQQAVEVDDFGF